jgi:hypothetical protein
VQVLDNRVSQDIYHEFNSIMDVLLAFLELLDLDTNVGGVSGSLSEIAVRKARVIPAMPGSLSPRWRASSLARGIVWPCDAQIKAMLQSFFADKKNSSLNDLCHALRCDVGTLALDSNQIDYMKLFMEDDNANQVRPALEKRHEALSTT